MHSNGSAIVGNNYSSEAWTKFQIPPMWFSSFFKNGRQMLFSLSMRLVLPDSFPTGGALLICFPYVTPCATFSNQRDLGSFENNIFSQRPPGASQFGNEYFCLVEQLTR